MLDEANRVAVWAQFMRDALTPDLIEKADLRAAVNATDDWIEANLASFNNALPQPFKGSADLTTKSLMFVYVLMRRTGKLNTEEDA